MLKRFLINNWFFLVTGFIIISGLGCYLWFQNDLAKFRQQHAPLDEEISQLEESTETEDLESSLIDHTDTTQSVTTSVKTVLPSKTLIAHPQKSV